MSAPNENDQPRLAIVAAAEPALDQVLSGVDRRADAGEPLGRLAPDAAELALHRRGPRFIKLGRMMRYRRHRRLPAREHTGQGGVTALVEKLDTPATCATLELGAR